MTAYEILATLYDTIPQDKYYAIAKELEVLDILGNNVVCKDGTTTTFDTRDKKVQNWLEEKPSVSMLGIIAQLIREGVIKYDKHKLDMSNLNDFEYSDFKKWWNSTCKIK